MISFTKRLKLISHTIRDAWTLTKPIFQVWTICRSAREITIYSGIKSYEKLCNLSTSSCTKRVTEGGKSTQLSCVRREFINKPGERRDARLKNKEKRVKSKEQRAKSKE